MAQIYSEQLTIPFDMTDVQQEIILSKFISYCLGVSGRQSAAFDRSDVAVFEQYGLVWVVTDYRLTISRLPRYAETVTIETEAVAYDKFICHRRFRVLDGEMAELLSIDCYFVLIDFQTRRLSAVPEELIAPYASEQVKKLPRLTPRFSLQEPLTINYAISYFDIDLNRHVNNGVYIDWIFDSVGWDFLQQHHPKTISLKYVKEISFDGFVESYVDLQLEREGLVTKHDVYNQDQLRFQAMIEWEARDDQ